MKALFHLAYHVTDLDAARRFYGDVLGCREGRSTDTWVKLEYQRMAQVVNAVLTVAHAAPASAASGVVAEHHNTPQ